MQNFTDSARLVVANAAMNLLINLASSWKSAVIDREEIEESHSNRDEIICFLMNKCKQYKIQGNGEIINRTWDFENGKREVTLESINESSIFFYGKIPILVNENKTDKGKSYVLSYIKKSIDFKKFVKDASEYHDYLWNLWEKNRKRFDLHYCSGCLTISPIIKSGQAAPVEVVTRSTKYEHFVYRPIDFKWEDLNTNPNIVCKDKIYMPDYLKDNMKDIEFWIKSKPWYEEKNLAWRRGWLLYGKPGNGKSTLVYNIAIQNDLPVYVFDIGSMSNSDFRNSWEEAQDESPAIILIEDIDAVFHMRRNIKNPKEGVSFDCLLNTIAGVGESNGIFLIITTNDISKIDPALGCSMGNSDRSTRPGRIDRVIEILPPCFEAKKFIANHVLLEYPDIAEQILLNSSDKDSYAQFKDKCEREAIKKHWETL